MVLRLFINGGFLSLSFSYSLSDTNMPSLKHKVFIEGILQLTTVE